MVCCLLPPVPVLLFWPLLLPGATHFAAERCLANLRT